MLEVAPAAAGAGITTAEGVEEPLLAAVGVLEELAIWLMLPCCWLGH